MVQALLALALVMAFMPLISYKISQQKHNAQMTTVTEQLDAAATAARIYLNEEHADIKYGKTVLTKELFSDTLEHYGLPLGFVPRTMLGQDISLVIVKNDTNTVAFIIAAGGNLGKTKTAEIGGRLGFWAAMPSETKSTELVAFGGGWHIDLGDYALVPAQDAIYIRIPMEEDFSELVRKNEKDPELNGFLTDLDMDGFNIRSVATMYSVDGDFGSVMSDYFVLFGDENGKKSKNNIDMITAAKATFKTPEGDTALSIVKSNLSVDSMYARTISAFGDTGNLVAGTVSMYEFSMTPGYSNFVGPSDWDVKESVITQNMSMTVDNLEVSSYILATRGSGVYMDEFGIRTL